MTYYCGRQTPVTNLFAVLTCHNLLLVLLVTVQVSHNLCKVVFQNEQRIHHHHFYLFKQQFHENVLLTTHELDRQGWLRTYSGPSKKEKLKQQQLLGPYTYMCTSNGIQYT